MQIIIVDSDARFSAYLMRLLNRHNLSPIVADEMPDLANVLGGKYDVIVLGEHDGDKTLALVDRLRKGGVTTPILLVSDQCESIQKARGLNRGADDYLCKPYSTEELVARIRALGRRKSTPIISENLHFEGASLDTLALTYTYGENTLSLSRKEARILEMLFLNNGRIVKKDELLSRVWGSNTDTQNNNVEVYISLLRKKLKSIDSRVVIRTVRGAGYCLVATD